MARSNNPKEFLTPKESDQVLAAVADAEKASSAEVKLIIARYAWMGIKKKAAILFRKHGLHRTEQHNCVLVLVVTTEREFLVYGDEGIHQKAGQDFWDEVRNSMGAAFAQDRMGEGLACGIRLIGEKLAEHFPRQDNDRDEIADEVGYDE